MDNLDEESYKNIIQQICQQIFKDKEFELKLVEINELCLEEENLDFKWKIEDFSAILNLQK